jgi:hypothetical protein
VCVCVCVCVCVYGDPPSSFPTTCIPSIYRTSPCVHHNNRSQQIGDTVDDIRAATAAGSVPIGVLTPEEEARLTLAPDSGSNGGSNGNGAVLGPHLMGAGAAVVLRPGLAELLEWVPLGAEAASGSSAGSAAEVALQGRRAASVSRVTKETSIEVAIDLDGKGDVEVETGIGFLDHMLTALGKHARFDLTLRCKGDLHIDDHHTAEDCALALGEAFDKALGERKGIVRFGSALCPLDEALSRSVVDISSRPHAEIHLQLTRCVRKRDTSWTGGGGSVCWFVVCVGTYVEPTTHTHTLVAHQPSTHRGRTHHQQGEGRAAVVRDDPARTRVLRHGGAPDAARGRAARVQRPPQGRERLQGHGRGAAVRGSPRRERGGPFDQGGAGMMMADFRVWCWNIV